MDEQIRIEYEISQLKANTFGIEVESTKNKKEYIIDIIVPQGIIEPSIYEGEISFVIVIQGDKYPYSPPRLYCTSQFCFPHFSDGRDILSSVLQAKWTEQSKLMSIIQLIPNFIKEYFTKGDLIFFGKYYLGEKYDLKLLQRTNNEISNVKENIVINGNWIGYPRELLVSDIYFLLFEREKWNKNKLTLMFWAPINSIIRIRKILVNKMVFIHWKQRGTSDPYEMCLSIDNGEEVVDMLLEKMQYFGINYNITKEFKGLPPKTINNEIDDTNSVDTSSGVSIGDDFNIEKVEEDIEKMEALRTKEGNNPQLIEMLSNFYYSAEKYYEVKSPEKAEAYKKKREELTVIQ